MPVCFCACVHENLFLALCGLILHGVFVFHPAPGGLRPRGGCGGSICDKRRKEVFDMAMYKARFTVYKDPEGKTLKGPTFVHFIGDLGSAFGLIGILSAILWFMEDWGTGMLIGSIVTAVMGFALCVILHRKAKKDAELAILNSLGQTSKKAD